MASIDISSQFIKWKLTQEEFPFACQFTDLNHKMIQNEIAICAEEKLALEFNPEAPIKFAQQEAFLAGKLAILQYILAQSIAVLSPTISE